MLIKKYDLLKLNKIKPGAYLIKDKYISEVVCEVKVNPGYGLFYKCRNLYLINGSISYGNIHRVYVYNKNKLFAGLTKTKDIITSKETAINILLNANKD